MRTRRRYDQCPSQLPKEATLKAIKRSHNRVVTLHDTRLEDMSAECWSYLTAKSRDVYVRILTSGRHVVTVSIRLPR